MEVDYINKNKGATPLPSEYLNVQTTGKPQINPDGVANSLNWVYINGLGERD